MTLEKCVGNTPMVELTRLTPSREVRIFAKLEGNNPGGSVKDRAALGMFMGAEQRGEIQPGMRIIEPTSGNTGIALAMIAATRGYPITLVMPENMTLERRSVMAAFGAHLELTPESKGMEGTIDRAREMVAHGEGRMFDQFSNPDNWRAHQRTTGPEIWRDTQGQVTHFVSSMGTTGTIMGVSTALKELNPAIQIIGVHPDEHSKIPGIRRWPAAYLPKIYDPKKVDRVLDVSAQAAREMTLWLARKEGLFSGHSAGGAVAAAVDLARTLDRPANIVVILPDRGDRYLSSNLFG
ncbi:MAG: cysteine synthase CysM [Magnetococcales bacterium]|nr:cysteine synthase CysM [Magnetococcales bacterium]MBF0630438.1 cysteine synthase CysM [Magnetococcales bacterium]